MTTNAASPAGRSGFLFVFGPAGFSAAAWLVFGTLFVALLPSHLVQGMPLWAAQVSRVMLAVLFVAPPVAMVIADRQRDESGRVRWLAALAVAAAAYVPALLAVLLLARDFPLPFLLVSMVAGMLVVLVPLAAGSRHIGKAAMAVGTLAVALLGVGVLVGKTPGWTLASLTARTAGRETVVRVVPTALMPVRVTAFRHFFDAKVAGGGIAVLGQGYIAASGEGRLFYAERDAANGTLSVTPLAITVPINHAQFFAETTQTGTAHAEHGSVAIAPTWFRVTDLLSEEEGGTTTLFAVHEFWKSAEKCQVLRVSMLTAPTPDFAANKAAANWQTVFETDPCLTMTNEGQGGRLVRLPDGALLLSVGVHDDSNGPAAQDAATHYGKTIRIDLATKGSEVFTRGHRNPQGLLVASNGDIWETEHGPRGGDELNRLERGANYGWPVVSYGMPYYPGAFPTGKAFGTHAGFEAPTFAWIPSIGISNVVEITGNRFPSWKNDLIVGSLVRTTLFRERIVDRRVAYVEEIKLDERIRDLIVDRTGTLVLWTDKHTLQFVEPLDANAAGSGDDELLTSLTVAKCSACHVVEGDAHGIGPNLRGLFDREVAGAEGYNYSEALRTAGGAWDDERLDAFLADPQRFAPGTKVEMAAVQDPAERRRAIEWLRTLH